MLIITVQLHHYSWTILNWLVLFFNCHTLPLFSSSCEFQLINSCLITSEGTRPSLKLSCYQVTFACKIAAPAGNGAVLLKERWTSWVTTTQTLCSEAPCPMRITSRSWTKSPGQLHFICVLIHLAHCLQPRRAPDRCSPERCTEAASEYTAKPLDCHTDEWTETFFSIPPRHG